MAAAAAAAALTGDLPGRWTPMFHHPVQAAYYDSASRFNICHAGRRSGKTELAKRRLVRRACSCPLVDGRFVFSAPTRAQAKSIFWRDAKEMIPEGLKAKTNEVELTVRLRTGAEVVVEGLDRPQRIEGPPLDWIVVDEIANCRQDAWDAHVLPCLSTLGREGGADLIGVPEGRNHYWRMVQAARDDDQWSVFHWDSAEIIDPDEVERMRGQMDPQTHDQEYRGSFVSFEGRAYYAFTADNQRPCAQLYDPDAELVLAFDFNVLPGTAAIMQEHGGATFVIGEVWVPRDSNTPKVCRAIIRGWGEHRGDVTCYGDATGGAKGSAKVQGSDWDLVKRDLRAHFGDRVEFRVARRNPPVRARLNAMNSRIRAADGTIRLVVDPEAAPHVVDDLEGVTLKPDGSGEIDKDPKKYKMLTHVSDGVGYYVARRWPVGRGDAEVVILG